MKLTRNDAHMGAFYTPRDPLTTWQNQQALIAARFDLDVGMEMESRDRAFMAAFDAIGDPERATLTVPLASVDNPPR